MDIWGDIINMKVYFGSHKMIYFFHKEKLFCFQKDYPQFVTKSCNNSIDPLVEATPLEIVFLKSRINIAIKNINAREYEEKVFGKSNG